MLPVPQFLAVALTLIGATILLLSLARSRFLVTAGTEEINSGWQWTAGILALTPAILMIPPVRQLLPEKLPAELVIAGLFCGLSVLVYQLVGNAIRVHRDTSSFKSTNAELCRRNAELESLLEECTGELEREAMGRRQAERTMVREKNKFEAVLAAFGDSLTVQDTEFRILYQNGPHKTAQGDHAGEYCYRAYHQREKVCEQCQLAQCFTDGQVHRRETSATARNRTIYMEVSASPFRDEEGNIIGGVELVRDITARKELEMQLRHAQKMEAVGSLAGGIAHDFNNLLTSIIGYGELILFKMGEAEPHRENIKSILAAGRRAAALTHQLLAFSRKQVLEMTSVNLNRVVSETGKLLDRLIDQNITVHFRTEKPVGSIKADVGQLEQIILNLAVNARDAMPDGGELFIETAETVLDEAYTRRHRELEPGPFVVLTVTDTGEGMSPSVREKIFEPFYTTKVRGKGTGLGLATVFGIVKQHRGHIHVYSEVGHGTTFKVYFPLTTEEAAEGKTLEESGELPRGTETILVTEDEPSIRTLIAASLKPLGYTVLLASRGTEALELLENQEQTVDLVLTDIIMKGMNGRELAQAVARLRPEVPIVYMSGYTDNAISHQGVLPPGTDLLSKPLTPTILARRLREILDRRQAARQPMA